jgi:hypothetical protein
MVKKEKRIKATSTTANAWKRLEFSEFTHWTTRHKMDKLPDIKAKVLKASAETVEEAVALSLALTLLQGLADKDLQTRFDAICAVESEQFHKDFPGYVYVLGGRNKGSKAGMTQETPRGQVTDPDEDDAPVKPKKKKAKK